VGPTVRDGAVVLSELTSADALPNEGCLVAFVDPGAAEAALTAMRSLPEGARAVRIGEVLPQGPRGRVMMRTLVGARRIVEMPLGEQLPRIC
jgi:hydrogenase expression/formation protein HypE